MKFTKIRNRILSVFTATAMLWTATAASIKITTDQIIACAAEETIMGDLNGDERIDAFDLAILKRKIAENDVTAVQSADVTGEGIVDTYDAREVQQFLLCRRTAFTASARDKLDLVDTSIVSTDEPIETSLTVEMAEKAKELGNAVAVYNYLYNNMRSEFYYGSRKGAIGAFEQGGGNDADLSSLLIAMLRYLGYDANYVTDTVGFSSEQLMKWTNTDSLDAALAIYSCQGRENTPYEHEGVTYYFCDYTYVQMVDAGITYYLDVCFKEYEKQTNSIQTLNSGVSTSDIERILQKTDLNYLDSLSEEVYNNAFTKLEDQSYTFSSKKLVQKNLTQLSTATPHLFNIDPIVAKTLDDSRCDTIEIGFNDNNKKTFHVSELYKKSVTVEYVVSNETLEMHEWLDFDASSIFTLPPYELGQALSVAPVIKVDGQIILTGPAIAFDEKQALYFNSKTGGEIKKYTEELNPGEICCIVFDVGSISPNELSEAYSKSVSQTSSINQEYQLNEKTEASALNENNVYNANYLGSILRLTGVMYFAQLDIYTQMLAEKNNVNCEDTVKIGVFGFNPDVYPSKVQVAGEPYGIDKNGQFFVDFVSNSVIVSSEVSDNNQLKAFNLERGFISSQLESAILEQIVGVECLSTVQLFKHAQEKGINIVSLSKDTEKKVSDLKISAEDAERLQAEIDEGNTIITMEQSITVGDWTGIGYIVETENRSSYTFKISGNMNGGICSSSVSVAAIIGISIDAIWIVESVALLVATLSAMTTLAFVPVATVVLAVLAIELLVFDILNTIENNYDYYMYGDDEAGTQVKINAAINVVTFGVTKIGGAIVSQVKNARNCGKYGENVISSIKNSGFTTAEVNAQISKFSKLGCTQSTIETLLKDAKCMFLGDDVLSFLGKQGGNQRLLAELVISNGDDFTKALMKTGVLDDFCNLAWKYGNGVAKILPCGDEVVKAVGNMDEMSVRNYLQMLKYIDLHRPNATSNELYTLYSAVAGTSCRVLSGVGNANDDIIRQNVQEFRKSLGKRTKQSNVGYAQISIDGVSDDLYAFAYFDSMEEAVSEGAKIDTTKYPMAWLPENSSFTAFEVANDGQTEKYLRVVCTEYKILSEIDKQIGSNVLVNGKIVIFTEKECCESCSDVIAQFIAKHPNVQIEIIHNNGVRLT